MKFSVLMTTYYGEKPEYLDASLHSILVNQSVVPNQLVLVIDGPISDELDAVVIDYKNKFSEIIDIVRTPKNQGQSKASQAGMEIIKYDILARMDSDDLSVYNRFEKELAVMEANPQISVVGGWISEFESDPNDGDSLRIVPENHNDIVDMFKRRMPINNVTAMIRKKALEEAGGYGNDTVNEDFSLYTRMWVNGAKFYNIQEVLVKVRVGNGMAKRRSDFRIFLDWKADQLFLYKNGKQSYWDTLFSCFKCFVFILIPSNIKGYIYKKFLRKKAKK